MLQTPTGTTMAIETIGPERADAILTKAGGNRGPRRGKIEQYARDMSAGRWYPSVIRFDEAGNLVDGQHRMWALVVSGTEQLFYVESGVSPDAIKTIDSGLARTAGDVLAIAGEANSIALASAIRLARWFDQSPGLAPSGQARIPFSHEEIVEYLDANPGLRDSAVRAKRMQKKLTSYGSSGAAAAIHYLGTKKDQEKADSFWDQMETGAEMRVATGPHTLRQLVIEDRLRTPRMGINALAAVTIKGFNYWLYDREVRRLQQRAGDPFPIIGVRPSS